MNNINPSADMTQPKTKQTWIWVLAVFILAGAGYGYFSRTSKTGQAGDSRAPVHGSAGAERPTPVVTAIAKSDDINVYLNGLGAVTPLATVTVKSRIDGEIMKIYFKEGQIVKAGELLAEIDPRPYQAALLQAEGQLMRDKALLANAKIDLDRYRTLLKEDSIAAQQVDTQTALVAQYEGTVKIDEGQLATARLNMRYSKVTAPVSGRVGLRQVDIGNIIHAADATGFVIITQLKPMSVLFSLPEDSIPDLLKKIKSGGQVAVDAYDRAFKTKITSGHLETIDNQIDPTTGMVKLRAIYANNDLRLFPSQFVNAQVLLESKHGVPVIPSGGVQHGRSGSFAFIVNSDKSVTKRDIVTGTVQGNKTEIISGVAIGETVVIDGADKLRDGAKVDVSSIADSARGSDQASTGKTRHEKATASAPSTAH